MRDFRSERYAKAFADFKALREFQGKRVTETSSRGWYPYLSYQCSQSTTWSADRLSDVYTKSGLIFACISEKAKTVADLELEIGSTDNEGNFEPIEDHEALALFYENPWYSFSQMIELFIARLDLTGASFTKKVPFENGGMGALIPMPTQVVEKVTKGIEVVGYRLGDSNELTDPEEIMEHSFITPGSYQCYSGPLQTILSEYLVDEEREKITQELLKNKNMPGYFMQPKDGSVTKDQRIQLVESMAAATGGNNESRGKGAVLPKGFDITMGPSVDDINYKELNGLTETRICMVFGVPPIVIGSKAGLETATYSNYGQARESFYKETILPLTSFLTDGFNKHLLGMDSELSFRFRTVDIPEMQEDVNEVAKRSALLFEKGVATRDESRAMVNLEAVEGDEGGFRSGPAPTMPEEGKTYHGKADEDEPIPTQGPAAIGSYPDSVPLEATLKREFRKQEVEALNQLEETGSVDMAQIGMSLGPAIETTLMGVAATQALKSIRKTRKDMGLSLDEASITGAFDLVQPNLEKRIREQSIELSLSTMKTTGDNITNTLGVLREELIDAGVRGPNTIKALQEGVKRVFTSAKDYRARAIAITESSRAVNDAALITDSSTGLVQGFTPVISSDACELCQVYIEDENGNAKATGIPRYPYTSTEDALAQVGQYENRTLPPYHVNCACTVAPVFSDEMPPVMTKDGDVIGVEPYEGGGLTPQEAVDAGGSTVPSKQDLFQGVKAPRYRPKSRPGGRPEPQEPLREFAHREARKAKQ